MLDFDALAPVCQQCGRRSGTVDVETLTCRACSPRPAPQPAAAPTSAQGPARAARRRQERRVPAEAPTTLVGGRWVTVRGISRWIRG